MRLGVRLAIDVGRARVGVAICDRDGLIATPVATLARAEAGPEAMRVLMTDHDPIEVVVGLPISLGGGDTPSTRDARAFADQLSGWIDVPVRLVDERLSTVSAQRALRDAGRRGRGTRSIIDQVAAVIILQNALDFERTAGHPPGLVVEPHGGA